jgi:hypothetical protein
VCATEFISTKLNVSSIVVESGKLSAHDVKLIPSDPFLVDIAKSNADKERFIVDTCVILAVVTPDSETFNPVAFVHRATIRRDKADDVMELQHREPIVLFKKWSTIFFK